MTRNNLSFFKNSLITIGFIIGCSSQKTLKITAEEVVNVSIVSTKAPDRIIEKIGNTPSEVDLEKLPGNMLKLTRPGKLPQYIYPVELSDGINEIQVNLRQINKVPEVQAYTANKADPNLIQKMLLDAFEAINIDGNIDQAETIADEMIRLDKSIFSPRLIKALVYLQKGDTENAKIQAEIAKSLDPSNTRVDEILKTIEQGI